MKSRLNINSIINGISIAFIYFLFDRSLSVYIITSNSILNSVYSLISQGAFVAVCLYFMFSLIRSNNILYYYSGVISVFIVFAGTMFVSTFINSGNIHKWFSAVYPTAGSLLFMSICCKNKERAKKFINAVSNLYSFLLLINLFFMILVPDLFGEHRYFVSLENQITIPLTIGFFFAYFNSRLNGNKIKFYLYVFIHITTSILAFSAVGLICMAFIYLSFFIKPIARLLKLLPLTYVSIFFAVILFFIVSGSISVLLNLPIVKYIIVDILGKNLTLTNRVFIWDKVIEMLSGHFVLGKGVADTYNLFYVHVTFSYRPDFVGTYSAHNQFLQTLYEGGIISLIIMLMASVVVSGKTKIVNDDCVSKIVIIAIIIAFFDEAVGYIAYFQIIHISSLMACLCLKNKRGD